MKNEGRGAFPVPALFGTPGLAFAMRGSAALLLAASLLAGCAGSGASVAAATQAPTPGSRPAAAPQKIAPDTAFLSSEQAAEAAEFLRLGRESLDESAWFEAAQYLDSALAHLAQLEATGDLAPAEAAALAHWRDSAQAWLNTSMAQLDRAGGAADLAEYIDHEIEEVSLASLEELEALIPRLPNRDFDLPLPSPLPHEVLQAMRVFTGTGRAHFERWLERRGRYEALILARLEERGMPRDLLYLSMVESGFSPRAWSHAGASGLWQFISATGRRYGLQDDWWEDSRRDPVRATDAALDYLEDLYSEFGDWHLAMAAYNCGEGRVRRQLREQPSYWGMNLPRETRYYVPKILAAMIIGRNPAVFGFDASRTAPPLRFDTATVAQALPLRGVAEAVGVHEDTLKALNPALRRWSTPPGRGAYTLYLPVGTRDLFYAGYDRIQPATPVTMQSHRVLRGQTLSGIAARYGVSMSAIREANGMRGSSLRAGQRLTIPIPGSREPVARTHTVSVAGSKRHVVRKGETLWEIARRYSVSVRDLRLANNMRPGATLQIGRKLRIPAAGRDDGMQLAADEAYYRVRSGDNLWAISSRFGNTVDDLKRLNDGLSEDLQPGQRIRVR